MSDIDVLDRSSMHGAMRRPNVAGVGAWLASAKSLREEQVSDYVPRHRASGPAH
jgi:hypothetical protein